MENDKAYITFLGYCLDTTKEIPSCVAHIDWDGLYAFAIKQTIIGIYAHTILEDNQALEEIGWMGNKLSFLQIKKWMSAYARYKSRNTKMNLKAVEVSRKLEADGFRTCILKGQANAAYYPYPLARTPGDIDIWVMTPEYMPLAKRKNFFIDYFRQRYRIDSLTSYHIGFHDGDVDIEAHFTPSDLPGFFENRRLQLYYNKVADRECHHAVELMDDAGSIHVPTADFCLVFQLLHIFKHLFSTGIGLRQVIDYYYLLKNVDWSSNDSSVSGIWQVDREETIHTIKSLGYYKFARALSWIVNQVLGLNEKHLLVSPDEKEGRFLMEEIMRAGNFGQFDPTIQEINKHSNHITRYFKHINFTFRLLRHYPQKVVLQPIYYIFSFIESRNNSRKCRF